MEAVALRAWTDEGDLLHVGHRGRAARALLLLQGAADVVDVVLAGRAVPFAVLYRHRLAADAVAHGDVFGWFGPHLAPLRHAVHWAARVVAGHQLVGGLKRERGRWGVGGGGCYKRQGRCAVLVSVNQSKWYLYGTNPEVIMPHLGSQASHIVIAR